MFLHIYESQDHNHIGTEAGTALHVVEKVLNKPRKALMSSMCAKSSTSSLRARARGGRTSTKMEEADRSKIG